MGTLGRGLFLIAGLGIGLGEPLSKGLRLDRFGDPLPAGAIARIGSSRLRHFWGASSPVLSPDGKILVAGDEEVIRFWDTSTGKELRHVNAQVGQIRTLEISPDGKYLAAGGGGGKGWMGLWELNSGKRLDSFKGQWGWTNTLAFSPDGKTLVSGGYGNTIYFWEVGSGRLLKVFHPPGAHAEQLIEGKPVSGSIRNTVEQVQYSPDGRTLISRSRNLEKRAFHLIQTWDLPTGKERGNAREYADELAFLFDPTGRRVLIQGENRLTALHLDSGKESPIPVERFGHVLAFSPDGKKLVSRHDDGRVNALDAETGKEIFPLRHASGACSPAFSRDGTILALGIGHALRLWDMATGKEMCPFGEAPDSVAALAFLPDAKTLITGDRQGWLHLWEARTGKEIRRFQANSPGYLSLSLSARGRTAAVASIIWKGSKRHEELRLWDVPEGKEKKRTGRRAGLLSPDGKTLACGENEGAVVLVDAFTDKEIRRIDMAGYPRLFSPDGKLLVTYSREGTICLWNTSTGKRWRELGQSQKGKMFWDSASFLSLSPDGKTMAMVWSGHFKPGDLEIWDLPAGRILAHFSHGIGGSAGGTCFSPDGKLLYLRIDDMKEVAIHAYDLFAGRKLGRLLEFKKEDTAYRGYAQDVAISPDGRLLASLLPEGTALIWDVSHLTAPRPIVLSDADLEGLWTDLGGPDLGKTYKAMGKLARAANRSVRFLQGKLRPVTAADPARLRQLLTDLDSDRFAMRAKAFAELASLGELAEAALRKPLAKPPSLELQKRINQLLEKLDETRPQRLQSVRAIQVLELIGTAPGRQLLQTLARGTPEARLTQEAQSALLRLGQAW